MNIDKMIERVMRGENSRKVVETEVQDPTQAKGPGTPKSGGDIYYVHFDRSVLAPGTTYTESPSKSPKFNEYLKSAGMSHHVDKVTSLGYDDASFEFDNLDQAKVFADAMDNKIPGPHKSYRDNYMPGSKAHHAQIGHYKRSGDDDKFIDTYDP